MNKGWTEEMIERLRTLVREGNTYSQIATIMSADFGRSFTRNACLAKAHRCGFNTNVPERPRPEKVKQAVKKKRVMKIARREPEPPKKEPPMPVAVSKSPSGLMDRKGCAFPLWSGSVPSKTGDVGRFCNDPVTIKMDGTNDSYCLPCRLRMTDTRIRDRYRELIEAALKLRGRTV